MISQATDGVSLNGRTIAVLQTRHQQEFAELLRRHGGIPLLDTPAIKLSRPGQAAESRANDEHARLSGIPGFSHP